MSKTAPKMIGKPRDFPNYVAAPGLQRILAQEMSVCFWQQS
jgi:hypothetical protein